MQLLKLLDPVFKREQMKVPEDFTVYRVETLTKSYCGRISYQDEVVIWLKSNGDKAVKILKENIKRITIL